MKAESGQQHFSIWPNYLTIVMICAGICLLSYFIGPIRYFQRILLLVILWAAITSGFNIISGYGGQIVFGYMMFVGTGSFAAVLLYKLLGISPWMGMWIGAGIAVILACAIGLPTLKLHGGYFAVATVAFPLMTIPILDHLGFEEVIIPFAGDNPIAMQFTDMRYYVLIAAVLLAAILMIIQKMEGSRFGFALKAIKQNETSAEGMGINAFKIKLTAFMLSAAIGSIAGAIYSFSCLFVLTTHAVFGVFIIVRVLSINVMGGLGTLWGPLFAAAILVPIGEFLNAHFGSRAPGVQDVVYGAALVVAIIYMPEGIWKRITKAFLSRPQKLSADMKLALAETSDSAISIAQGEGALLKCEHFQPGRSTFGTVLRIEGISKSFGGVLALRGVNMEVPQGKILSIIGPNGAGKTTLFNVINGYLKPEAGKIFLEGRDVTDFRPHALCKMGMGRTFQVAQIFHNMTVLENVMVGALSRWGSTRQARTIALEVVEKMGLTNRAHHPAVGLSIWETKILEIGRALATQSKLLLLDEPMAGLNPEETYRIGEMIKAIAKSGITVLVIEHVVQSLLKVADLMIGLDEGRKVAEGTPEEVTSNPYIIEAYLGTKWKTRYAKG